MTVVDSTAERQTDAELVVAARAAEAGASDAFGKLVLRYQRMVYALVLSLVRESDADDVAQEAFVRAFRNLDLLADPSRFGVWLRRITFGAAIDHVRASRSREARLVPSADTDEDSLGAVELDPADPGPSPLERLEQREVAARVLGALERLPARYRVPLTLYHIDGLTHAKVARTLGVPEATVRSLVARARKRMAQMLPAARAPGDVLDDEPASTPPRFLHVLNGDSVRYTLERSDVPGAFAVYAEVLHEGPVPRETGTHVWRAARARYLSARGYVSYADAMRIGEGWEAKLERFADYDEVVLWFEHDLFDQLLLIRHLDWFSRQQLGRTRLSLICIGEFPGFEPFHGLGQLDADQLTSLLGTRQPVSTEQMALGVQAWRAFTAADPADLDTLARSAPTDGLPFLPGALRRFVEEYPAVGPGLPRTEREILRLLAERSMSPVELFVALQRREERVFMGDTTFWLRITDLAAGASPLVQLTIEPTVDDRVLPDGLVEITETGRDVLHGRADWVRLNGFDRWLGGVHLVAALGGDVAWRYDPEAQRLVTTG